MREIKNLPVQFMDRAGAYGIDIIIVFFFILVGIFSDWNIFQHIVFTTLAYSAFTIFPAIKHPGQSLGKLSVKTKVVTEDYQPVPLGKYILRMYFIALATLFTFLLYPIISMILLDARNDKRSLHDLMFGTRVVLKDSKLN